MRCFATCFFLCSLVALGAASRAADHVYGTVSPWGELVDPDGDCSFTVSREAITIGFSGAAHGLDAEQSRMNAPRALRSMEGSFAVEVTVDGNLPLPDDRSQTAYVSGGLVLLQDDRNYIRLERASFTRGGVINHYANFEQRVDAKRTRMGLFRDYPLSDDRSVEFRLEVKAGIVRVLARNDGQPWHEMGTAKMDPKTRHLNKHSVLSDLASLGPQAKPAVPAIAMAIQRGDFGTGGGLVYLEKIAPIAAAELETQL